MSPAFGQVLYRIAGRHSSPVLADERSSQTLVALIDQESPDKTLMAYGLSTERIWEHAGQPTAVVARRRGYETSARTVDVYGDVDRTGIAAAADAIG